MPWTAYTRRDYGREMQRERIQEAISSTQEKLYGQKSKNQRIDPEGELSLLHKSSLLESFMLEYLKEDAEKYEATKNPVHAEDFLRHSKRFFLFSERNHPYTVKMPDDMRELKRFGLPEWPETADNLKEKRKRHIRHYNSLCKSFYSVYESVNKDADREFDLEDIIAG